MIGGGPRRDRSDDLDDPDNRAHPKDWCASLKGSRKRVVTREIFILDITSGVSHYERVVDEQLIELVPEIFFLETRKSH